MHFIISAYMCMLFLWTNPVDCEPVPWGWTPKVDGNEWFRKHTSQVAFLLPAVSNLSCRHMSLQFHLWSLDVFHHILVFLVCCLRRYWVSWSFLLIWNDLLKCLADLGDTTSLVDLNQKSSDLRTRWVQVTLRCLTLPGPVILQTAGSSTERCT